MDIGFTGTQKGMTGKQANTLRLQLATMAYDGGGNTRFHHGDCVGADAEAHDIAHKLGFLVVLHPPTDESKRAWCVADVVRDPEDYMRRNDRIVQETTHLVACPSGTSEELRSGTWATIRRARRAGRKIMIIWPDGGVDLEG